ncbi:MAG: tetratricopeptide repeat protein [Thermodesulfobacteriota bacterium]
MKKSQAAGLAAICFIAGILVGLLWAAYKGPPPGLEAENRQISASSDPARMRAIQDRLADLKARIKAQPGQVDLYVEAGNLLFDNELHQQAIAYYEQALELGGENPDVLTDCAISYRQIDQSDKTLEMLRRARKTDPRHVNSALNLGIVLFHDFKDKQGALTAWREYLNLAPEGDRAEMIRRVVAQIEAELK